MKSEKQPHDQRAVRRTARNPEIAAALEAFERVNRRDRDILRALSGRHVAALAEARIVYTDKEPTND